MSQKTDQLTEILALVPLQETDANYKTFLTFSWPHAWSIAHEVLLRGSMNHLTKLSETHDWHL